MPEAARQEMDEIVAREWGARRRMEVPREGRRAWRRPFEGPILEDNPLHGATKSSLPNESSMEITSTPLSSIGVTADLLQGILGIACIQSILARILLNSCRRAWAWSGIDDIDAPPLLTEMRILSI